MYSNSVSKQLTNTTELNLYNSQTDSSPRYLQTHHNLSEDKITHSTKLHLLLETDYIFKFYSLYKFSQVNRISINVYDLFIFFSLRDLIDSGRDDLLWGRRIAIVFQHADHRLLYDIFTFCDSQVSLNSNCEDGVKITRRK